VGFEVGDAGAAGCGDEAFPAGISGGIVGGTFGVCANAAAQPKANDVSATPKPALRRDRSLITSTSRIPSKLQRPLCSHVKPL
jgi:hypothetical protein